MNKLDQILVKLGRVEGQMNTVVSLSERVAKLEVWQNRLKGAFTASPWYSAGYFCVAQFLAPVSIMSLS